MIHPSYVDLMQVVNKGVEEGETPELNQEKIHILAENEPDEEEEILDEALPEEEMEAETFEGDEITE